jgi:hypothetical protein
VIPLFAGGAAAFGAGLACFLVSRTSVEAHAPPASAAIAPTAALGFRF